MLSTILFALVIAVVPSSSAIAQDTAPHKAQHNVQAEIERLSLIWRNETDDYHYYDDACCFCARVDSVHPTENPLVAEYVVKGTGFRVHHDFVRAPDPKNPTTGTILCDPYKRQYLCIISDAGV